jgi:glycerophosphodiester phosphodiesterase
VQVTRDLVPVLFHDYSLSESGTDVPIHDVTLDQVSINDLREDEPELIQLVSAC